MISDSPKPPTRATTAFQRFSELDAECDRRMAEAVKRVRTTRERKHHGECSKACCAKKEETKA